MRNTIELSTEEFEQLNKFSSICHKIYIARNITLNERDLLENLREIDVLLRDKNEN